MRLFDGVCAFPITPADPSGRVDTGALSRLLERLQVAGVASVGLLGSTGIYAYLSRGERRRAIEAAVECLKGRTPLMVGVGALRTDEAEALAKDAEAAGADALLLAPVSYTPLTVDEVHEHCRRVAGASGLPLCLYNNPSTTRFTFDLDLLTKLSAERTIKAVKMPLPADGDVSRELAELRTTGLSVGYSGDWGCADALRAGADAWYSVIAGLLPRSALHVARLVETGDVDGTTAWQAAMTPLWDTFKAYGSVRVIYLLYRELGFGDALPPLPIRPLEGASRDQVLRAASRVAEWEHAAAGSL